MRKQIGIVLILPVLVASLAGSASAFTLRVAPQIKSDIAMKTADSSRLPPTRTLLSTGDEYSGVTTSKSKTVAVVYSLLLPGLGHYYVGDRNRAKLFFAVEGVIWTNFIVFMVQGYLREEGYKDFAQDFAGISGGDHSDDYYSIIGEYDSWVQYEEAIKSDGRLELYPDVDTETLENYFANNRVSDYEPWVWKSEDIRRDFRHRRSASRRSYRRALYAFAAALLNRTASAFFAIGAAKDAGRDPGAGENSYRVEFGAPWQSASDGFQTGLSIVKTF
ncbi:MAG: hypothetical protein JSW58_10455 [Candidatus Latescibacterota bacterium]|nr:MAG: hypothetical protein JSW58_10455 [Candidatus Latescibacterota bacterium]